jgi:hypothetical protein
MVPPWFGTAAAPFRVMRLVILRFKQRLDDLQERIIGLFAAIEP